MAERFIQKELGVLTFQQQDGSVDYCPLKPEVNCNIVNGQFVVTIGGQPAMDSMGNQVGPYVYDGAYLPYTSVPVIGGSFITAEQAGAKIDALDLAQYTPQTQPQEVLIEVSGNNRSPIVPIAASLVTVTLLVVAGKRIKHKLDMLGDKRFSSSAKPKEQKNTPISNEKKHADRRERFKANQDARDRYDKAVAEQSNAIKEIDPQIEGLRKRIHAQLVERYDELPDTSAYRMHYEALKEELSQLEEKKNNILAEYNKTRDKFYN